MGQHKHNPTALAAARGEISKSDRKPRKGGGFAGTSRSVLDIKDALKKPVYVQVGPSIRRRHPKVRGKALVKAAKRARILARELAAA